MGNVSCVGFKISYAGQFFLRGSIFLRGLDFYKWFNFFNWSNFLHGFGDSSYGDMYTA